jgi:hypothetical protein
MAAPIEDSLREIDAWFNELPGGTERPKLLSKLAVLELCGWLEHRLDKLIARTGHACGLDPDWVNRVVIAPIYGFSYTDHIRPGLVKLVGERGVLAIESKAEADCSAVFDQLKSELGTLWKLRSHLAHTNTGAPVAQQVTINAPSWSINHQRIVAKCISAFEEKTVEVLNANTVTAT